MQPVGGGNREQSDIAPALTQESDRFDRFGSHGAGIGNHDFGIRSGLAQPVSAFGDARLEFTRHDALRLVDRAGGQPQIDRPALALLTLHVPKTPAHDHGEFINERRLKGRQSILRHTDQRRRDRLVCAAFRRKRNAGGRCRHHKARILIAGIVQRIEAALDEGIVEGCDR